MGSFFKKISPGIWLQMAVFILAFAIHAWRATEAVHQIADELHRIEYKFDRVEKYLSSKDLKYWETIRKLEEPPESPAIPPKVEVPN